MFILHHLVMTRTGVTVHAKETEHTLICSFENLLIFYLEKSALMERRSKKHSLSVDIELILIYYILRQFFLNSFPF